MGQFTNKSQSANDRLTKHLKSTSLSSDFQYGFYSFRSKTFDSEYIHIFLMSAKKPGQLHLLFQRLKVRFGSRNFI